MGCHTSPQPRGPPAAPAAARPADAGVLVSDLRIERRTLDDAYLALTGSRIESDGMTTKEDAR